MDEQFEGINESVKDETSSIGKVSPVKSKNFPSSYENSKFEPSLQKSTDITGLLKNATNSRRSFDEKFSSVYHKVAKLKKEYDHEIGKINGLRNKSLYLYKLKKDADDWNKKVKRFYFT